MSIATWNVNGLRSAQREFGSWLTTQQPEVACIQETRLTSDAASSPLMQVPGYRAIFNQSGRGGHSGTAIYTRLDVTDVQLDVLGADGDSKGRSIMISLPGLRILNVYMPHGGRDGSRLGHKAEMYASLLSVAAAPSTSPLVIAGDLNVARNDIDLKRPAQNRTHTMFTPDEREQLDALIDLGYVDSFRYLHPDTSAYSWWPYLAQCRERDIGWRIDYLLVHPMLKDRIAESRIEREVLGSDHCPVRLSLG